jgi:methylenetetrahydrofolate dehydrogenase (NADP+) / methenyltetrahydrofolate cyclohydrolase
VRLIDGRAIAAGIAGELRSTVAALGATPTLAVVVPTDDPATAWYVRSIQRTAGKVGIDCRVEQLDRPEAGQIAKRLDALSADPGVHGIICQTPLPAGVKLDDVGAHIDPAKDVDGANPLSLGRLVAGLPGYPPATAAAVLEILRRERVPLAGATAVVVGRSTVVGKPVALLLLAEHATVTVCHSRTVDLAATCARADILVAAAGRTHLIGGDHIKPGAVVIDVGTNPTADGGLAGDVDPGAASGRAGALTPVPGGVGPVTTMLLMRHTALAAASGGLPRDQPG